MRKEYLTVACEATAELEEKKSRFIASVKPAATEEEAVQFIKNLKTKYWDATHNVYAYYIGGGNLSQKFSDDGEPSGTAGLPVLEAIKKAGLEDVVVVVTRYFGGTLLGAAGLVRAYGKSASLGIEAAGIVRCRLCFETNISMDYPLLGKVQALTASKKYKIKDTVYAQDVNMTIYIPVDEIDGFRALITEMTNAQVRIDTGEKSYITEGV